MADFDMTKVEVTSLVDGVHGGGHGEAALGMAVGESDSSGPASRESSCPLAEDGGNDHVSRDGLPELLLERGAESPPLLLTLSGGERAEDCLRQALGTGSTPASAEGGTGEGGLVTFERLQPNVTSALAAALQLGVPGMHVGELAVVFAAVGDGGREKGAGLERGSANVGDDAELMRDHAMGAQEYGANCISGNGVMLQVEVELLGLDVASVTPDGGILARIEHANDVGSATATAALTPPSRGHEVLALPVEEGNLCAEQAIMQGQIEGDFGRLEGERLPQKGDIALVSYVLSYRGQVLLDLREPHEVRLSSQPSGRADDGEILPGIVVLILQEMRKGSRCIVLPTCSFVGPNVMSNARLCATL